MNILPAVTLYSQPVAQPRSAAFTVNVNGDQIDALHSEKADFAVFECSGPVDLTVTATHQAAGATIRPQSRGITPEITDRTIRFQLNGPQYVCVDVPGSKPLFIYANAPELNRPVPGDADVLFYAAGRIHEAGEITLKSGETLYIEAGAVVRGNVRGSHARNVSIRGRGILDGSCHDFSAGARTKSVVFDHCTDVRVDGIVMIEPSSWMLVVGNCQGVHVDGLKQIGSCISSDGIDICGSRDVLVENCCLRNDDDNIAVKAGALDPGVRWENSIENVLVRNCVFLNGTPGNVMEIGYELCAARVSNVVFENIDVIAAHGEGAVFSIHNGDRAIVENIRWENVRVEHYWDKLVDFRVVKSRYNKDPERGLIRNVHLKNIRVVHSYYNPGCSISLISGHTAGKPVRHIVIEDFYLNEKKILSADALELHTRNVEDIRFI